MAVRGKGSCYREGRKGARLVRCLQTNSFPPLPFLYLSRFAFLDYSSPETRYERKKVGWGGEGSRDEVSRELRVRKRVRGTEEERGFVGASCCHLVVLSGGTGYIRKYIYTFQSPAVIPHGRRY